MARHPKPKPHPSSVDQLKAWALRRIKRILWISAAVATLSGGLVGGVKAWPLLEPWVFAHRGYVREAGSPLLQRLIKVQLKQTEDDRRKLLRDAQRLELELQSDQSKATPQYHALVQKEIERVKNDLKDNDEQQKSLFNEKVSK